MRVGHLSDGWSVPRAVAFGVAPYAVGLVAFLIGSELRAPYVQSAGFVALLGPAATAYAAIASARPRLVLQIVALLIGLGLVSLMLATVAPASGLRLGPGRVGLILGAVFFAAAQVQVTRLTIAVVNRGHPIAAIPVGAIAGLLLAVLAGLIASQIPL